MILLLNARQANADGDECTNAGNETPTQIDGIWKGIVEQLHNDALVHLIICLIYTNYFRDWLT